MIKLVTLEQAKKLKELGYAEMVWQYFCGGEFKRSKIICDYNADSNMDGKVLISAPSISETIDWFREERGIMCYVDIVFRPTTQKAYYIGKILNPSGLIIMRKTSYFDSHSLAELALLDALIEYVSK